jgi:hypothetical protein
MASDGEFDAKSAGGGSGTANAYGIRCLSAGGVYGCDVCDGGVGSSLRHSRKK